MKAVRAALLAMMLVTMACLSLYVIAVLTGHGESGGNTVRERVINEVRALPTR